MQSMHSLIPRPVQNEVRALPWQCGTWMNTLPTWTTEKHYLWSTQWMCKPHTQVHKSIVNKQFQVNILKSFISTSFSHLQDEKHNTKTWPGNHYTVRLLNSILFGLSADTSTESNFWQTQKKSTFVQFHQLVMQQKTLLGGSVWR